VIRRRPINHKKMPGSEGIAPGKERIRNAVIQRTRLVRKTNYLSLD